MHEVDRPPRHRCPCDDADRENQTEAPTQNRHRGDHGAAPLTTSYQHQRSGWSGRESDGRTGDDPADVQQSRVVVDREEHEICTGTEPDRERKQHSGEACQSSSGQQRQDCDETDEVCAEGEGHVQR